MSNHFRNVWVDDYSAIQDFEDGAYCRGAWDTRRAYEVSSYIDSVLAWDNIYSAFQDGLYAVEVIAWSQASHKPDTIVLPVDDVTQENPTIQPIIVDNFVPYLQEADVYEITAKSWRLWFETTLYGNNNDPAFAPRYFDSYLYGNQARIHGTVDSLLVRMSFSEQMDYLDNTLPINLYTILGPDTSYYATFYLEYMPYWANTTTPDNSLEDNTRTYVHHFYVGSITLPSVYQGKLFMTINPSYGGGNDQAGNHLDMDFITVAPPKWYNSMFNYEDGDFIFPGWPTWGNLQEFEQVSETSRTDNIGGRTIETMRGYFLLGGVKKDSVDISVVHPDIRDGYLMYAPDNVVDKHPDCGYYEGFWVASSGTHYPEYPISMYIVKGDSSVIALDVCDSADSVGVLPENCKQTCDRYGWIAWMKYTQNSLNPNVTDVYMYVTAYDSYDLDCHFTEQVGFGHSWDIGGSYANSFVEIIGQADSASIGSIEVWTCEWDYGDSSCVGTAHIIEPPYPDSTSIISKDNSLISSDIQTMEFINSMSNPFPNPTNSQTSIRFQLEEPGMTTIDIYDLSGRLVQSAISEELVAGNHTLLWDLRDNNGSRVPTGVYCARLVSGSFTENRKILVIR